MRERTTPLLCAVAGAVVFSVLLERLSLLGALAGAAAGLLFAAAVRPMGDAATKPFRGLWLLRYGALLVRDMARATARQMRAALHPQPPDAAIVHLRPTAAERGRVLVSNSITLTPGTVTLEETETEYAVLCAGLPASSAARRAIAADFEARLHGEEART